MRHNGSEINEEKLRKIIPGSMGFTFKKAGYETFYGGKVHLPLGGKDAHNYGFDNLISLDERDDLAEKSAEFLLSRKSEAPFFTVVNFINPHNISFEAIRHFPPKNRKPMAIPDPLLEAIQIPGATAGITEMLLQLHLQDEERNHILHILPALPSALPDGKVTGLRAMGGFEVDFSWKNGKLMSATAKSLLGNPLVVRYGEKQIQKETKEGQEYHFKPEDFE